MVSTLRGTLIALALALSSAVFADGEPPLGYADARHLLVRSGFGSTPKELERISTLDRETAVSLLLGSTSKGRTTTPPNWVDGTFERADRSTPEARKMFQRTLRSRASDLDHWWLAEMIRTDSPLAERMTLFWHGHFTSSVRKVKRPIFLYQQNDLFRRHATGSFRTLLHAVAKDPAMMLYLDTVRSSKKSPNENFPRELFELFTLGEGHYTENDIKEAARAFTGWRINPRARTHRVARRRQDRGEKTIFGKTGTFDGSDVIDLVLDRPRTATFIVEKLWREFVSPDVDDVEVARIAQLFRDTDYQMAPVLRALFTCDAFWARENRGAFITSPIELVVGTIRTFDLICWDTEDVAGWSRLLGQDVFDPPNVAGWPGGARWINATSLIERERFLTTLRTGEVAHPRRAGALDPDKQLGEHFARWIDELPESERSLSWLSPLEESLAEDAASTEVAEKPTNPTNPIETLQELLSSAVYQLR